MITRSICFRFEVRTPACLTRGLPALLDLARELDVRFTFFVNTGKAALRLPGKRGPMTATRLSAPRKLGWRECATLALRNPPLAGLDRAGNIARAAAEGHDLGLLGGRNHAAWRRHAHTWTKSTVRAQVEYSRDALRRMGVDRPDCFASPGWNTPPELPRILSEHGIRVLADRHGTHEGIDRTTSDGPLAIPTEFTGEPGGIGYLDWCTARGATPAETLSRFAIQLDEKARKFAVLHELAAYAGIRRLGLLREMLVYCRHAGITNMTLAELASAHEEQGAHFVPPPPPASPPPGHTPAAAGTA